MRRYSKCKKFGEIKYIKMFMFLFFILAFISSRAFSPIQCEASYPALQDMDVCDGMFLFFSI